MSSTLGRILVDSWFNLPNPPDRSKETDSVPLLGEDESVASIDSLNPPNEEPQTAKPPRNYPFIFNICLTIFNIALVLYAWHYLKTLPLETSFYPVHSMTHTDIAKLRRPSQWVNLEKMYTNMRPKPRTFTNWPLVLAPVDPEHPNQPFGNDPKRLLTLVGLISPEDREFRVTEKISTIAQFRAIDFKMEYCQLVVKPPPAAVISGRNNLEIYELEGKFPIHARDLTFTNRPSRRGSPLALTSVFNGSEWRYNLGCPSDTLFTFEFTCERGSNCDIDWWQNKEPHDYGLFLTQSSVEYN